jgi:hypothetical protein
MRVVVSAKDRPSSPPSACFEEITLPGCVFHNTKEHSGTKKSVLCLECDVNSATVPTVHSSAVDTTFC